jgi:hypothetical protein
MLFLFSAVFMPDDRVRALALPETAQHRRILAYLGSSNLSIDQFAIIINMIGKRSCLRPLERPVVSLLSGPGTVKVPVQ